MDIALSIILCLVFTFMSTIKRDVIEIEDCITDSVLIIEQDAKAELVVGNNLMRKKEPKAYHKILIELGLDK